MRSRRTLALLLHVLFRPVAPCSPPALTGAYELPIYSDGQTWAIEMEVFTKLGVTAGLQTGLPHAHQHAWQTGRRGTNDGNGGHLGITVGFGGSRRTAACGMLVTQAWSTVTFSRGGGQFCGMVDGANQQCVPDTTLAQKKLDRALMVLDSTVFLIRNPRQTAGLVPRTAHHSSVMNGVAYDLVAVADMVSRSGNNVELDELNDANGAFGFYIKPRLGTSTRMLLECGWQAAVYSLELAGSWYVEHEYKDMVAGTATKLAFTGPGSDEPALPGYVTTDASGNPNRFACNAPLGTCTFGTGLFQNVFGETPAACSVAV